MNQLKSVARQFTRQPSRKGLTTTSRRPFTTRLAAATLVPLAAIPLTTILAAGVPPASEAADTIMSGGHVKTPDGWAEALAMRKGIIVAVGPAASVEGLKGPRTTVVDLHGSTVLPGLHDVHVHPLYGGLTQRECRIPQGSSLLETQRLVKQCVGRARVDAWVTGGQWDAPALGRAPNRTMLDEVASNHPVLLEDTSGHSAWASSKALAIANITRSTPDPSGGIIERDVTGEPTGVLREDAAIELVRRHVPKPTEQEARSALEWSLREMLSYGITSFTEAAVGFVAGSPLELKAYTGLADAGILKQRVTLCLTWAPGNAEAESVITWRNLYARDRLSPDCVKIFLDGVPTDGHTAAMLEPYADAVSGRADDAGRTGLLLVKQDALDAAVTRFDAMGLTVKFHAAGDAAVRAGLDAIGAARKANGFTGQMHNVGHCTFVAQQDLARARAIGATFEVSPYLWAPSPINDAITAAVGDERVRRVWPVREMLEAGALVVPGSDWAVVPSVNPWIGIESLVTREAAGGSQKSFGKTEAISVSEAIDLFTVNAARQARRSNLEGRIAPGMLADIIVVDQNPYEIAPTRIHDTQVRMTFIGGEKVYDSAASTRSLRP